MFDWEAIFKGQMILTPENWMGTLSSPNGPVHYGAFKNDFKRMSKNGPIMTLHPDDSVTFSSYENDYEIENISPSKFW